MKNPETVIRRYLEAHGGRAESHIRHLTDSWELTGVGEEDLKAIEAALAGVGVVIDPPLQKIRRNGTLTLYIADEAAAAGGGTAVLEAEAEQETRETVAEEPPEPDLAKRRRRFVRRVQRRGGPAKASPMTTAAATAVSDVPSPQEAPAPRTTGAESFLEQERAYVDARLDELAHDRTELQQHLADVRDELERARTDAETAREEVGGDVVGRLAELEGRLRVMSVERQAEVEALFRGFVQWADQVPDLQARVRSARKALDNVLVPAKQGEDPEARADPALAEVTAALAEARGHATGAEQRMAAVLQVLDRESARTESVMAELDRLQQAAADAILGSERREAELRSTLEGEHDERRRLLEDTQQRLSHAQQELHQARAEAKQIERQLGEERRIREALERKAADLDRRVAQAEQRHVEVDQNLQATSSGLRATRKQLEETERRVEQAMREAQDAAERVRPEAEAAAADRRNLQEHADALQREMEEVRGERDASLARLTEAVGPIDAATQELDSARSQLELGRAELERLRRAIATAEQQLEEKQAALADAGTSDAERGERHAATERELAEFEAARQEHRTTLEHRRDEFAALNLELESALADAERRAEETAASSRVVTEVQRAAAAALFAEAGESAKLDRQLHAAIAREQESRSALERHHLRAATLRQDIATVEIQIAQAEAAEAEATTKLEGRRTAFEELSVTRHQVEEAVNALHDELETLRAAAESAATAIEEREALVDERRLALEQAHRRLREEAGRQAGQS